MPLPFQAGLFLTVLVLAVVRFERSLRGVLRAKRPRRAPDAKTPDSRPAAFAGAGAGTAFRAGGKTGLPGTFNWGRWYHFAILWGLAFFCVPFLLAVAFPGRIMDVSRAVDRALTGGRKGPASGVTAPGAEGYGIERGSAPVEWDIPPVCEEERRGLECTLDGRTARARTDLARGSQEAALRRRSALIGLGFTFAVLIALGAGVAVARRMHRPGLLAALAAAAFTVAAVAFVSAGPISSRLSAARRARRVIESYAAARTVRAEEAGLFAGAVKIVGRPTSVVGAESGFLYFRGPGGPQRSATEALRWGVRSESRAHGAGKGPASPHAGFRVGDVVVPPAGPGDLRVVLPHVRLGPRGRELFIREDEDVLVIGYLLSGGVAPRPGYPVIVAPAGAAPFGRRGGFEAAAADLLGAERLYGRCLVLLQSAFAALAAWFLTVLCAACSERVMAAVERKRLRRTVALPKSEADVRAPSA